MLSEPPLHKSGRINTGGATLFTEAYQEAVKALFRPHTVRVCAPTFMPLALGGAASPVPAAACGTTLALNPSQAPRTAVFTPDVISAGRESGHHQM